MNQQLVVGGFRSLLLLSAIFAAPAWLHAQPQIVPPKPIVQQAEIVGPKGTVHVKDLHQLKIIGLLGAQLGEVMTVEAEIISGDTLRWKGAEGHLFLNVKSVGGVLLKEPILIRFQIHSQCHEKLGLDKTNAGKTKKLLAYETGEFAGAPRKLPRDFPVWADIGFGFSSYLMIMGAAK